MTIKELKSASVLDEMIACFCALVLAMDTTLQYYVMYANLGRTMFQ